MAYSLKNFVNDHPSWQKLGRFYYKTEGNVIVSLSQRNRYFDLFFSCNIAENKQKDLQKELASVAEKYFIFDVVCVEEGVQVVFRKIEVSHYLILIFSCNTFFHFFGVFSKFPSKLYNFIAKNSNYLVFGF